MQEARKYRGLFIQAWAPARIAPDKWRKRKTEPIYAGFKNWEILTRFGHDSWCKNKLDPRNQKSHYYITGILKNLTVKYFVLYLEYLDRRKSYRWLSPTTTGACCLKNPNHCYWLTQVKYLLSTLWPKIHCTFSLSSISSMYS